MENKQIKSKNRVVDHGEVLTPDWLVNDMLDLIPLDASKAPCDFLNQNHSLLTVPFQTVDSL